MHVRAAVHGDAVALVPLFEQWGHPQTADQVSAILTMWSSAPFSRVLVAEDDSRLVGMAAISASPRLADFGRNATLAGLVVATEQRRKGVGRLLLAAAEDLARSWGCVRLELTSSRTRDAAHAFYPSNGYEETSERQARYVRALSAALRDPTQRRATAP